MFDFKKLAQKHYDESSPEERARIDVYHAAEARYNLTLSPIEATFTMLTNVAKPPQYREGVVKTWNKTISMRIEDREGSKGPYEVLRFIGGSTGHEVYELSPQFVEVLQKEGDEFYICAGSVKYDRCVVSCADVLSHLEKVRPQLFAQEQVNEAPLGL